MEANTTTLYRPVGPGELVLIEALDWRAFPPRLEEAPIFYPASALPYAEAVASSWNLADSGEGYVVACVVDDAVLAHYPEQVVGVPQHRERWVPAEELMVFNRALVGPVRVVRAFRR